MAPGRGQYAHVVRTSRVEAFAPRSAPPSVGLQSKRPEGEPPAVHEMWDEQFYVTPEYMALVARTSLAV